MRIIDVYFAVFGLTNIALIHLACCMDDIKSKCVFYAVACVVTSRMSLDMYIYANANYSTAFCPGLLSMAWMEAVLLRFIIHRMKKICKFASCDFAGHNIRGSCAGLPQQHFIQILCGLIYLVFITV